LNLPDAAETLYENEQIVIGTDNKDNSFHIPASGKFNIRIMADKAGITSVHVSGENKTLEYKNGQVLINGVIASPVITFAGNTMNLLPSFVYQGSQA
jgi:hypothetical protein